jgi:hypothetical protein
MGNLTDKIKNSLELQASVEPLLQQHVFNELTS